MKFISYIHKFIDNIEFKQCTKCGEWKTLDNFYVNNAKKDKLQSACIKCQKNYLKNNPNKKFTKKKIKHRFINNIEYKWCNTCKQFIPLTDFHKASNSPDGVAYRCKKCVCKIKIEKERLQGVRPKEERRNIQIIDGNNYKKCCKCNRWLPWDYFSKDKNNWDGLGHTCKECYSEYSKIYYKLNKNKKLDYQQNYYIENIENILEKNRKYRMLHPEKMKEYKIKWGIKHKNTKVKLARHKRRLLLNQVKNTLTTEQWIETILFFTDINDNIICAYCGKIINNNLTLDHIIPLYKNGSHTQDNVLCACKKCNSSKHTSDMEEWYQKQYFYDENKLNLIYKHILISKIKEYIKIKESD